MTKRILIMGLPGAGKTTLAQELTLRLESQGRSVLWLNADRVREEYNDWDFSSEGRVRQSKRMRELADAQTEMHYVIADFVAPLPEMRDNFGADFIVWVDTIAAGRYADTNAMFVEPGHWDFRVTTQDADHWSKLVAQTILATQ